MIRRTAWVVLAVAAMLGSAVAETAAVRFTQKPTVAKTAQGVKIDFTVSAPTDVAVFIEDGQGKIVRHLVAGVIGKPGVNPPAPSKANSLAQSVVWDGKADYSEDPGPKTQDPGLMRVRVALGLGAQYDKVLISDPRTLGSITGLAVGPDGTVFVVTRCGGTGPTWNGQQIVAFNRDGSYQQMVTPFPANLTLEQAKGFDVIELDGRPAPLIHSVSDRNFYDAGLGPRKGGMAVTKEGVVLRLIGVGGLEGDRGTTVRIGALDSRGAACWGRFAGPALMGKTSAQFARRNAMAVSSDGKWAYVCGLAAGEKKPLSAVYRVKLPERSPAEPFFGDPNQTGDDATHLGGSPFGLAADGKGRLLISDYANNRVVVVSEADGKFVSAFKLDLPALPPPTTKPAREKARESDKAFGPDCLAVDVASGAVYMTRLTGNGNIELVKLNNAQEAKPLARRSFPRTGNSDFPWLMAVDCGVRPAVIWLAGDDGSLLRLTDQGDNFSEPEQISRKDIGNAAFMDVSIDRTRQEIYVRGELSPYWWFRFNEPSGKLTKVQPASIPQNSGSQLVVAPDGMMYSPGWPDNLLRFNYDGSLAPWPIANKGYRTDRSIEGKPMKYPSHGRYVPVSMTYMTHTVGVRRDGHIFVLEADAPGGRPPKMLIEYLPNGERLPTPIIWKVSDTAVGPKFDPQGNIYIAEQVKLPDQPYPTDFKEIVGPITPETRVPAGVKESVAMVYGSILKFSPKGGAVDYPASPRGNTSQTRMDPTGPAPYDGEAKLDPSLKRQEVTFYRRGRLNKAAVVGAEWIHTGVSQVGFVPCNCETTRFDVDEFGRVWYPDMARFRVVVLDTNGNPITQFGGYGNAESCGPESKDPALAKPDIAFSWLIGVGATDRYAYMGDSLSRRLLRAKLVYAAEETCPLGK